MSCTVNLLPAALVHVRVRNDRARGWGLACGTMLTAIVGLWAGRIASDRVDQRLEAQAAELTRDTAEKSREVVVANSQALQAAQRLNRLAGLLRYSRWPERYERLAATAPTGIFLTELIVKPGADTEVVRPSPDTAVAGRSVARVADSQRSTPPELQTKQFRIVGYAANHGEIASLVAAISSLPGCSEVQLVSATSDAKFKDFSIRFECSGISREGNP